MREAQLDNQSIADPDVLSFATSDSRAVLTNNRRDFIQLHRLGSVHAGIIVCTEDPDIAGQAQRIDTILRETTHIAGQLLRVYRPGS
jgi:hypothetical protein